MSEATAKDHERIWLEPQCCDQSCEGRGWSSVDMGKCIDCDLPSVEYVRADLVPSRDALLKEAAAEMEDAALQIEYLHEKFQPTSSGMTSIARLRHNATRLRAQAEEG